MSDRALSQPATDAPGATAVHTARPATPREALGGTARAVAMRSLSRRWYFVALAAVAGAVAAPIGMVSHGTKTARACVGAYESPRGADLPDCRTEIRWFILPSRVPWTAMSARYLGEEIAMRAAVATYDDAAIGTPNAARLESASDELARAQKVIRAGSQRVALEGLGRAIGAPDPGRSAVLRGDRRTLVHRADAWEHWSVRVRALEAALLEGDGARAAAIAKRYAEFDPRDEELRVALGAMLCLGGAPKRGRELLATVQDARATEHHEAWTRNWGDVRALLVACADKEGAPPPPLPFHNDAGTADRMDVRLALRLRLLAKAELGDALPRREAAVDVIHLLKTEAFPAHGRVRVLAALLALGHGVDPNLAALLAQPHVADGESPLLPQPEKGHDSVALQPRAATLTAIDWLGARGLTPSPPPRALHSGAAKLRGMATSPDVSAEERAALEIASDAMAIDAWRALAIAGDTDGAIVAIDAAGTRAVPNASARALLRSSAWYVSGDRELALAELAIDPGAHDVDSATRAAWWIQKAELFASLARRDEAARAAIVASEIETDDREIAMRARWTRLALAPHEAAAPLPSTRAWPWVGELGTEASWLDPEAESAEALTRAIGFWSAARHASSEDRRALRYAAAAAHRGDAPPATSAYLAIAGELLHEGEGDVDVWLDAFAATWSRRLTMRAYAWARTEAARFRGDGEAAARWAARYRSLVSMAASPDDAELCEALGI